MRSTTTPKYTPPQRLVLSGLGSMQILRAPDFLVATTTLLTHGVGLSTGEMTPN